jgi:ferredoxin
VHRRRKLRFRGARIFSQDKDGTVVVRKPEVSGDEAALAENAADNCPAFAITIERGSDPAKR